MGLSTVGGKVSTAFSERKLWGHDQGAPAEPAGWSPIMLAGAFVVLRPARTPSATIENSLIMGGG